MEATELINNVNQVSAITALYYALSQAGILAVIMFALKKPIVKAVRKSGIFDEVLFAPIKQIQADIEEIKPWITEIEKIRADVEDIRPRITDIYIKQLAHIGFDERYTDHERITALDTVLAHGYDGTVKSMADLIRSRMTHSLEESLSGGVTGVLAPARKKD